MTPSGISTILPSRFLLGLLQVEKALKYPRNLQSCSPLFLFFSIFSIMSIFVYHSIMLTALDQIKEDNNDPEAVIFSLICNFVTLVTTCLALVSSPLAILLGEDTANKAHRGTKNATVESLSDLGMALHDRTSWLYLYGSVTACLVNQLGEILFLITGFSADGDGNRPSLLPALVHATSSMMCTAILTLGTGHLVLAYNVFAVQIEGLANLIHKAARMRRRERDHNEIDDSSAGFASQRGHEIELSFNSPDNVGTETDACSLLGPAGATEQKLHVDTVGAVYLEFRRRQDVMAARLNTKIGIVMLALCTETIIMVTQVFGERKTKFARTERIGIFCTFAGNAFALWSLVCSIGRVLYASRETLGFAVTKWAWECADSEGPKVTRVAQMIKDFPLKFHAGIFELTEESIRGIALLVLALASCFVGAHLPQVV